MTRLDVPQLVLIDLDGTLVDSVPDLAASIDLMLGELALPLQGESKVRHWVGNGMDRLVKRALVGEFEGEPDEVLFQQALPIFKSHYSQNHSTLSRLYDGVIEGLDYMRRRGLPLGCVTNKPREFTLPLLAHLQIDGYFELVIGGDDTPEQKPHPMPLLVAAERVGADPRASLMIGDSISDLRAARAAGFQIICTSYGYNHGEDIRRYGPDAVIDSMAELENLI